MSAGNSSVGIMHVTSISDIIVKLFFSASRFPPNSLRAPICRALVCGISRGKISQHAQIWNEKLFPLGSRSVIMFSQKTRLVIGHADSLKTTHDHFKIMKTTKILIFVAVFVLSPFLLNVVAQTSDCA